MRNLALPSRGEAQAVRMRLQVGDVVITNYGTGPFLVTEIHGPCACPEYLRHINGDDTPSEPHFHLEVIRAYDALVNSRSLGEATLPAYRATHALRARLVAMLGRAGSAAERHSEQPRFLGAKAVNSPLSRKTVKCWVFERGSDVT